MKKLVWFAVLLAGCGGRPIRVITDGPPPPGPVERRPAETVVDKPEVVPVATRTEIGPAAATVESLPRKPEAVRISEVNGALEDVYFGYDKFDLSVGALASLRHDASLLCAILTEFPGLIVVIEGHCDDRGSAEYNLGLGDRRARRAEAMLKEFGVPEDAVQVISYGKESPVCTESKEECWQRNRRAHVEVKK